MRILIHGLNFTPELVGVGKTTGETAEWLAGRGHDVRVVTAPPFNPEWRVAPGFSGWRYSREDQGYVQTNHAPVEVRELVAAGANQASLGWTEADPEDGTTREQTQSSQGKSWAGHLTVLRCPLWVPADPSAMRRILHLASFAVASFPVMLRQIRWRPDVVLVMEPTLFCIPAALLTGRLAGAKTWLHVLDFEADAAFELGLIKSSRLKRAVAWIEARSMSAFDRVSTISERMLARLEQKGVARSASVLFPNWADTQAIFPLRHPSPLRAELGISASEVVALYAGTMARKQGLEMLAGAALRLANRDDLRFVFCGEGPGKPILRDLTAQLGNVLWIPLQPLDRLNDLLNLADIHLLPQRADAADLVMPSKLTGMLASGRPVVATSKSGTQVMQVVQGRGVVVDPEDAAAFADAIMRLASSAVWREALGVRARDYAVSELEKESILSRFEDELRAPAGGDTNLAIGASAVAFSPATKSGFRQAVKRGIDILGAGILLIALSPLFLALALAVKVDSAGGVFYDWRVVGWGERPFLSYKFRSMVGNADDLKNTLEAANEMTGPVFKITGDPRITRVGKWMRRYSLDELPQLYSVLKGDMSLVGPRPPLETEFARFTSFQKRKLAVKPGITCLWQVKGRNRVRDFDEWVRLDLEYIRTWSLASDFRILLQTAREVVRGSGK